MIVQVSRFGATISNTDLLLKSRFIQCQHARGSGDGELRSVIVTLVYKVFRIEGCHVRTANATNKEHLTASYSIKPSPIHPHPVIRLNIHPHDLHLPRLNPLMLYLPQFHQLLLTEVTLLFHWRLLVFSRMSFKVHVGVVRVFSWRQVLSLTESCHTPVVGLHVVVLFVGQGCWLSGRSALLVADMRKKNNGSSITCKKAGGTNRVVV